MPSPSLLRPTRRRQRRLEVLAIVLAVVGASCSSHNGLPTKSLASASGGAAPVVTPANPYVALDYANRAQRKTFQAFLTCAASHGVEYEGPFTDSSGQSVYFRLAAGVTARDDARRQAANSSGEPRIRWGHSLWGPDPPRSATATTF